MMTYNPPYYRELIEQEGYTKAMDLLAYRIEVNAQAGLANFPPKLKRIMDKTMAARRHRHSQDRCQTSG